MLENSVVLRAGWYLEIRAQQGPHLASGWGEASSDEQDTAVMVSAGGGGY